MKLVGTNRLVYDMNRLLSGMSRSFVPGAFVLLLNFGKAYSDEARTRVDKIRIRERSIYKS